jgi:hypothetical protein
MIKTLLLVLVTAALIILGVSVLSEKEEASIVIDAPKEGATVTSPLTVIGKARGGWYFEASFPVRLLDALGNEIAVVPAQAQGEWMTEDFVPFIAELTFSVPSAQYGKLILMKDNPSGLPENDEQVEVAVWLDPSGNSAVPEGMSVKAFFGLAGAPAGTECTTVAAVERIVPQTEGVARAALDELLKGPSADDIAAGFTTSIPEGVIIKSLDIATGTARVDFNAALERGVAGSCRVTHIREQIEATLTQFPTIEEVIISIDGRTGDVLQP